VQSGVTCLMVASEFGTDNAGTHRQVRWALAYLRSCSEIVVLYPDGALRFGEIRCREPADLARFRAGRQVSARPARTSRSGVVARWFRFLKYYLLIEFLVPRNLLLVIALAQRLRETPWSVVHVSTPPFPFAFYTVLLTRWLRPSAAVHIDVRDPWARHRALGGITRLKLVVERFVYHRAQVLTTAGAYIGCEIRDDHGVRTRTAYNVATHVPSTPRSTAAPLVVVRPTAGAGGVRPMQIAYVGTMPDGFYDLDRLASFLVSLDADPTAPRVSWNFVGECSSLAHLLRDAGPGPATVGFAGRVPHREALDVMAGADALLFIGHQFPGYLTTKLFEYLALGRPVLPLFLDPDFEAYQLIERLCGTCPVVNTYDDLRHLLADPTGLPRLRNVKALEEMVAEYAQAVDDAVRPGREGNRGASNS
jgi:glycosyltransferase involved in cell wall biosynthesis